MPFCKGAASPYMNAISQASFKPTSNLSPFLAPVSLVPVITQSTREVFAMGLDIINVPSPLNEGLFCFLLPLKVW